MNTLEGHTRAHRGHTRATTLRPARNAHSALTTLPAYPRAYSSKRTCLRGYPGSTACWYAAIMATPSTALTST
ncbi:hypothetical protein K458DRAFT_397735 [Lentithecium fluviatile CBS 122367]|uniref:Uncharacterized protein n=1 Tax=Lentithecium fluviatile CBS 122367 TaxID=1168545 RepID=A0A6G1ICN3_9PLEO|nr:hypothetical protein K458DRAFT_397735 [Lentithecium fluviatile CBS 122367]